MKKKITGTACGLAAASIVAFMLTACGDDSSSVSPANDTSSVQEPLSSGSDTPASNGGNIPTSSGNDAPASSDSNQASPASSDTPAPNSIDTPTSSVNPSADTVQNSNTDVPPTSSSDVVPASSSDVAPTSATTESSSSQKEPENCRHITDYDSMTANGNCDSATDVETVTDCLTGKAFRCAANYWVEIDICPPGSKCNRDTISGTPCDRNGETLVTEDNVYQCNNGVWLYLPPPMGEKIVEEATNVKSSYRGGPAVAPSVVKVKNADGTVSIQDDGVLVNEVCTFNGLRATLSGDTLYATILYPECSTTGGFMGTITFTLSDKFVNVKYIKYDDNKNVHEIREVEELNDCGNNASCTPCGEGLTC